MIPIAAVLETLVAALAATVVPPDFTAESPAAAAQQAIGLPLTFVENAGQWDTPARFVASTGETLTCVEEGGFQVVTQPEDGGERLALRFDFEGARAVQPVGRDALPGVRNYFVGNDPEAWRSGVRGYARIVYPDLYEGVDLQLREADGRLEYDLCLAPGADVSSVVVRCAGVEGLTIDERGGLLMQSAQGPLRQTPPLTWCVQPDGEKQPLECEFVVLDATSFGFRLAERDQDLPVVIDPGLEWATYLGGSMNDTILGMARKANGEIVVTGITLSPDFDSTVVTHGPGGGFSDSFVSILDPTGSTLVSSAVFGGSGEDIAFDVQLNAAGEVFVSGTTATSDFPVTAATALMPTAPGGQRDAWILRLSANLSQLEYSSYLGGSGSADMALRLHVREPHVVTVGGSTNSTDHPTTAGALQPAYGGGGMDYFLCRLDLDQVPAAQLLYWTYLGGAGKDGIGPTASHPAPLQSLILHEDASGQVTLAGQTNSDDWPTTSDGYQQFRASGVDACLASIDPSLSGNNALLYGTYIGGEAADVIKAIAIDASGVITLGGWTYSPDFPTTPGAFDTSFHGPTGLDDNFLLQLDPTLGPPYSNQLLYSTFLTGSGSDALTSVALTDEGYIVAQGSTAIGTAPISIFPTTCGAWSQGFGGVRDAYVFLLNPAGNGVSDLLYSTYVGGSAYDSLGDVLEIVSTAPTLKIVGAGWTEGTDFPATAGSYQPSSDGARDGFVLQLELNPHTYCDAAPNTAGPDGAIICGSGSVSIADNAFALSVTGAPPQKFGMFFYSDAANEMPFGEGTMCVALPLQRIQPVLQTDASGSTSLLLDFTQPPLSSGPFAITPNSTWYFQFWYRDPMGGPAGYNVSNGLKAFFYP